MKLAYGRPNGLNLFFQTLMTGKKGDNYQRYFFKPKAIYQVESADEKYVEGHN